jgi:hypothetical protein
MMGDEKPSNPNKGAGDTPVDPVAARRVRQAEALRANLRRRKDQARRQAYGAETQETGPEGE